MNGAECEMRSWRQPNVLWSYPVDEEELGKHCSTVIDFLAYLLHKVVRGGEE